MKKFNITAQVYSQFDQSKQTILVNQVIEAPSEQYAIEDFEELYHRTQYIVVKIYSIEPI